MKCGKKEWEMLHAKMRSVSHFYSNHLNAQLSVQQMTRWDQQPVHFNNSFSLHLFKFILTTPSFRMTGSVMVKRLLCSLVTLLLASGASAQGDTKMSQNSFLFFIMWSVKGGAWYFGGRVINDHLSASSCDFDLLCIKISPGFSHHH